MIAVGASNCFMDKQKVFFMRVVQRIDVFLFSYVLVLLFFFLVGNFQKFLDSSQTILLTLISFFSILLLGFSCISLLGAFFFSIYQKTTVYLLQALFTLVLIAFSALLLFFSAGVNYLSWGTGANVL